jgi:hypothetical protein
MSAIRARIACILPLIAVLAIVMLVASPSSDSSMVGRIWGRVTYHGRPVTGAGIAFCPVQPGTGSGAGAKIGKDGLYFIDSGWIRASNARVPYTICILPEQRRVDHRASTSSKPFGQGDDQTSLASEISTAGHPTVAVEFPAQFSNVLTSRLQVTLDTESARVDIDLKD